MQIPYLNQILLFLVVSVLTTILSIAGIEVIHILREFRETIRKTNRIMDDFQTISSSVAKPIAGISGFLTGLKSGLDVINLIAGKSKKEKGEK